MSNLQTKITTDTWVAASGDEYIQVIENHAYEKAKGYYYNGRMRVEISALGNDHSLDHALVILAASNYAAIKGIPMNGRDNCSFRDAPTSNQRLLCRLLGDSSMRTLTEL